MKLRCFFCGKRTINMMRHKEQCKKWIQISNDVLFHEILIHTRYFNLVKKLATSKNYKRIYKTNFSKCRSRVKINKNEAMTLYHEYPPIIYFGDGNNCKFMYYKCQTLTTILWYSYKKNNYLNYIYYMVETDEILDNIYERIINRIFELDNNYKRIYKHNLK